MKELHCTGNVEEGVLKISHRRDFDAAVQSLGYKGGFFAVFKFGNTRKLKQNALYWVLCTNVAKQLDGWTPEEVHEENKRLYNSEVKPKMNKRTGEITEVTLAKTTTDLTIPQFNEFIRRCEQGWAEQGIDCWPEHTYEET